MIRALVFDFDGLILDTEGAAGIFCVAVPNRLTERLDLSRSDVQLASLAHIPLPELLTRIVERSLTVR